MIWTASIWPEMWLIECRGCGKSAAHFMQHLRNKLIEHKQYVREYGDDMPEIRNWKWPH